MTPDDAPAPVGDAARGAAVWEREWSALLRGINHALGNRVAAIGGIATMIEPAELPDAELVDALRRESARLEGALHLLRMLAGPPVVRALPLQLGDVLPRVALLHAEHPDVGEGGATTIRGAADVLPVVVPVTALAHALLALLAAARRAGGGASVVCGGDERTVTVVVAPEPAVALEPAVAADAIAAARWALRDTDVHVRGLDAGIALELVTLPESRRRAAAEAAPPDA